MNLYEHRCLHTGSGRIMVNRGDDHATTGCMEETFSVHTEGNFAMLC